MAVRRTVVHIGLPKTATTYLQRGLFANAAGMAEHGVYLPQSGRLEFEPRAVAHHHLAWQLFSPQRFNAACGGWEELRQEIDDIGADTVLLSSEEFSRVPSKGLTGELENRLLSLTDDVTIVLVVRDQLSLLNSVYLQRVKSLTLMPSFSEYVDRSLALGRFDLERSFAQWYDSDRVRFCAIPFSALLSGDLLQNLLAVTGVEIPGDDVVVPESSINPSLGPVGVEAAHLLSRYLHGRYPDFSWRDPVGRRLHRNAGVQSRRHGWCDDDFWGWSPELAARAEAHYRVSNNRFAEAVWGTRWPEAMPVDRPEASAVLEDLSPRTVERVHQFVFTMARRYQELRAEATT